MTQVILSLIFVSVATLSAFAIETAPRIPAPVTARRNGGIIFARAGRLRFSFCIVRRPQRLANRRPFVEFYGWDCWLFGAQRYPGTLAVDCGPLSFRFPETARGRIARRLASA